MNDTKNIQRMIDEIDSCIKSKDDEVLTLQILARKFGYSEYHFSRRFKELSGMRFRDYLRYRKLAFALKRIRDTKDGILQIALDYGFSSNEAFTRAFKKIYGLTPSAYRRSPVPVLLHTMIKPFDFETENSVVEEKMEKAMRKFDYSATGYQLDYSFGRIFYFYYDCKRFWKYIRPVKKIEEL